MVTSLQILCWARLRLIRATHVSNPQQKSGLVSTSLVGSGISIYLSSRSHASWAQNIFHISGTYLDSGGAHNSAPKHIYHFCNVHLGYTLVWLCLVYCTSMGIRYKSQRALREIFPKLNKSQKVVKEEKAASKSSPFTTSSLSRRPPCNFMFFSM